MIMKRLLSGFLALLMVLSNIPAQAFAAETEEKVKISLEASTDTARASDEVTFTMYVEAKENATTGWQCKLDIPEGLTFVPGSGVMEPGLNATLGAISNGDDCSFTESSKIIVAMASENVLTVEGKVKVMTFKCTVDEAAENGEYTVGLVKDNFFVLDETGEEMDPSDYTYAPASVTVTDVEPLVGNVRISLKASSETVESNDTVTFTMYVEAKENATTGWQCKLYIPDGLTFVPGSGVMEPDLNVTLGATSNGDDCSFTESSKIIVAMASENVLTVKGKVKVMTFQCAVDESAASGEYTVGLVEDQFFVLDEIGDEMDSSLYTYTPATISVTATVHTCANPTVVSGQAATCTDDGWNDHYKCSCGKLYADNSCTTEIADLDAWKIGDGKIEAAHNPVKQEGQNATCENDGWKSYYECECGDYFEDASAETEIEDLESWKTGDGKINASDEYHNYGERIEEVPAKHADGVSEAGFRAHFRCSVCGGWFDSDKNPAEEKALIIPAPEHDSNITLPGKDASCKEEGLTEGKQCSVCGYITVAQEVIDKTAHTWVDANCETPKTCSVCGATDGEALNHNYSVTFQWSDDYSTCTAIRTCANNPDHKDEEPVTATVTTVEATCSVKGGTTYTAVFQSAWVEDKTQVYEDIGDYDKTVHKNTSVLEVVAATCTTEGKTEGLHCNDCGIDVVPQETIGKLEHDYDNGVVTNQPTCQEKGVKTFTCKNCPDNYFEYIDKLDHNWSAPAYTWGTVGITCNATRTCSGVGGAAAHAGDTVTARKANGQITSVTTAGTCTVAEVTTYTVTFSADWAGTYTDKVEGAIDPNNHPEESLEVIPGTEQSCTTPWVSDGEKCTACGVTTIEQIQYAPAKDHAYEGKVTKEATCKEPGEMTYTCKNGCGDTYTGEIPVLTTHTEKTVPGKAATCTETGLTDGIVCSVCGVAVKAQEEIPALEHDYEGVETKAATCKEAGIMTYTCKNNCGDTYTKEIPVLDTHTEEVVPGKAATCEETGLTDGIKCSVCGVTVKEQEEIPALDHDEKPYEGKPATCTEEGWEPYVSCSRCDYTTYKKIPALNHDLVQHNYKASTCDEVGWNAYVDCSRCDYTTYQEIPKREHYMVTKPAQAPTCEDPGWEEYSYCQWSDCAYSTKVELPALDHDIVDHEAKAATCTEIGWDAYETCSRCDYTTYEEIAALNHDIVDHKAQAATCTEIGWNAYKTCTRCDYTTYKEIAALNHNTVSYPAKAATCTTIGWNAYVECNRCDYTTYEEIAALDHDIVNHEAQAATCTENGWDAYETCTRCSHNTQVVIPALNHDLVQHEAKAADCENAGWNAHETCTRCDYTTKKEVAALNHKEVTDKAVAPDCENTGLTEGKHCSVCEKVLVEQTVVDALGHTEVVDAAVAPDCENTGLTEGKHCSVCEKVLTAQEEIPATNHKMAEATCTKPSFCENEGCGYTEGEPLGHTEVIDEDRMALCEDTGLTEGSHCSVCGTVLIEQQVIPALGHDIQQFEAKKPTYTGAGWDAYEACSRCAYTTKVEIPALEEPVISDYGTFIATLPLLEEIAYNYVLENPGKDPAALVIKYIRTGVERYNSGSWGIMAGYEDAAFAEYVSKLEDEYNSNLADGEELLMVSGLKNLKNFTLPNGDIADLGHVFGMMDITYHNNFGLNHMDIGGWLGDTVDLLSLADQFGVSGTVDEMVKDLTDNYLLKNESTFPEKPIEGSFSLTDMQGDLDGYYIMHKLQKMEYNRGTLTSLMSSYFTEGLNDVSRAEYLLKNRLGGVTLREEVRKAVYNAYTGNKMVKTLEDTREFTSSDLANLKKACCYAVADYLCRLAGDFVDVEENPYFEVFSSETSTLAPGISQDIKYATSADNKQMVFYIATADVTRSDVDVFANYTNDDPTKHAMSRVLDQANFAQEKYGNPESEHYIENYNVIASVNGAGYNMSTGEPAGILVMHNGVEYHPIDHNGFFGILKDGTPVIGTAEEYNTKYKGQIRDAIAGFGDLVKDSKVVATDNITRASRTAVGITRTGKVVFMVLDGRQEPFSCGGTMQEIAQIMMEAGCEIAINLDGGGSTTFVAKPEGGTELEVVSRPSDGSARSVSTSWLVVSTAPSSTAFDHAVLETATNYMTAGSSQQVTAEGVSGTGNAAALPEDATWAVSDSRYGTITEDGVFTAKQNGSVDIYMMSGDKIIGSKTMNIVLPNNVYFTKSKIDVVYGETVDLPVKALYDGKPVTVQARDLVFTLDNPAAGTVDGFQFTCSEEGNVKSTKLTVKLAHDATVSASISLALYNQGEATFNFDKATGGNRQFAWDRKVSNSTTEDAITYHVVNAGEDMVTSYIFAIDMTQIPIPQQLDELIYMLPGSDVEGASAWVFLMQLAQRVSVLTEVRPTIQIDPNFDVDYSGLTLVNEYFELKETQFDEETNTLQLILKWKKQTQAIDPAEANPMCILSGIKLIPKEDASWNDKGTLNVVNKGEIGYNIYLRASSLYTFAQKPENQEAFNLMPFVNPDDPTEAGASFGDIYHSFKDSYTLVRILRNGWINEDGGIAYYVDGVKHTGVKQVDGIYYDFGEDGINVGQTPYTGLFTMNGNTYYAKLGQLTTGWNQINGVWHLFDEKTGIGYNGTYKNYFPNVDYVFDHGRLTSGVWLTTDAGTQYYYGPDRHVTGWKVVDGKTYYFMETYRYEGVRYVLESNNYVPQWFDFGKDGALIGKVPDGLVWFEGKLYYSVDGVSQLGLQFVDGYYYYFKTAGYAATGKYYVTNSNGLLPSGYYDFDEYGRMIRSDNPVRNGIYNEGGTLYYYVNNQRTYAGLIYLGGHYYYANSSGKIVTGNYYVTKNNGLMPSDYYDFDQNGRMILSGGSTGGNTGGDSTVKNGIYNEGGALYYYENGVKTYAGLIYRDGYYYYVNGQCKVVTGNYYVTKNNGLLPSAYYNFDQNGRMILGGGNTGGNTGGSTGGNTGGSTGGNTGGDSTVKNGIYNEGGALYYYENGVKTYAGLIYRDGYYYYVNGQCKVVTGNYYVTKNNGLLPSAYYDFDQNGRMILGGGNTGGNTGGSTGGNTGGSTGGNTGGDSTVKNGIYNEGGALYYYENGVKTYAGLIYRDGYYYYVNGQCKVVTGNYYVTKNNGLLPSAYYNFDQNGRMILGGGNTGGNTGGSTGGNTGGSTGGNTGGDSTVKNGIYNEGGALYYYENGVKTYAGLIYRDGYYYYVNGQCKVVTGNYYVTKNNGLLPSAYYDFDQNGRMILGGGNTGGNTGGSTGGNTGGSTGGNTGGDSTVKNGIYNEGGTLYYYENGVKTYAGLIYRDGYYYYVNGQCKVVTGNYYVTKNNGLLPSAYYDFDQNGRMILSGNTGGNTGSDTTVKNGIYNEGGALYYYENGVKTYAGLIYRDGYYYYVNGQCKVVTGNYYVTKNNGLLPSAYYNFAADGRMILR